jgi:hypothetical protein
VTRRPLRRMAAQLRRAQAGQQQRRAGERGAGAECGGACARTRAPQRRRRQRRCRLDLHMALRLAKAVPKRNRRGGWRSGGDVRGGGAGSLAAPLSSRRASPRIGLLAAVLLLPPPARGRRSFFWPPGLAHAGGLGVARACGGRGRSHAAASVSKPKIAQSPTACSAQSAAPRWQCRPPRSTPRRPRKQAVRGALCRLHRRRFPLC